MPGRGRQFPAGQSGNPSGRPRGAKDRAPRPGTAAATLLRHALAEAFEASPSELAPVIRAGLRSPRLALGSVEFVAKLNGEMPRRAPGGHNHPAVIVVGAGETIAAFRAAAARVGHRTEPEQQ